MLFSNFFTLFLENRNDSFNLFFFLPPPWFSIFHDNEFEESEVFYLSALCFALRHPSQKDFLFREHSESQEFLLQF